MRVTDHLPWPIIYVALLASILFLMAGCTSDRAAGLARLTINPERINLTAAIAPAILSIENACLVARLDDGRTLPIIWQEAAALSQDGRAVMVKGKRYAVGDRLALGGSTTDVIPASEAETIGSFVCAGPYVVANTVRHDRPHR